MRRFGPFAMANSMTEELVVFDCEHSQLIGIAHRPSEPAKRCGIVFVVGGPQYRVGSHRQFTIMARSFASAGYAVLRFDYRGMGDSEGHYLGFEHVDSDIRCAIDAFIDHEPGLQSVILCGLCDAASACLIYCKQDDRRVAGLILLNPESRTQLTEAAATLKFYYRDRLFEKAFWVKVLRGEFDVFASIRGLWATVLRTIRIRSHAATASDKSFVEKMLEGLRRSSVPILLLESERDLTAKAFADLCVNDKHWAAHVASSRITRRSVAEADHTFARRSDMENACAICREWLDDRAASLARE